MQGDSSGKNLDTKTSARSYSSGLSMIISSILPAISSRKTRPRVPASRYNRQGAGEFFALSVISFQSDNKFASSSCKIFSSSSPDTEAALRITPNPGALAFRSSAIFLSLFLCELSSTRRETPESSLSGTKTRYRPGSEIRVLTLGALFLPEFLIT